MQDANTKTNKQTNKLVETWKLLGFKTREDKRQHCSMSHCLCSQVTVHFQNCLFSLPSLCLPSSDIHLVFGRPALEPQQRGSWQLSAYAEVKKTVTDHAYAKTKSTPACPMYNIQLMNTYQSCCIDSLTIFVRKSLCRYEHDDIILQNLLPPETYKKKKTH